MMEEEEEDLDEEGRKKTMMMMMKTLMKRGALMLMMIKMMILQAELDKRESQWAAAVDNLKLRNCDEQVLLCSVVVDIFLTMGLPFTKSM